MTDAAVGRSRILILGALLALSGVAWGVLVWQGGSVGDAGGAMSAMGAMDAGEGDASRVLTMGMALPLFMGMWVLMMIAMMFPTAAPMVLTFASISRNRRAKGEAFVPTWVFVGSYLAVWSAFGVAAFLVAVAADRAGEDVAFLRDHGARIGGAVLALAGLYQLSPWKGACLTKCRSPLSFVLTSWREGYTGAVRMGLSHGTYCLGCCWLLFVILFPLGVMNVAAMGLVTLLIFTEKSVRHGELIGKAVGAGLVLFGLVVLAWPSLLPTTL